MMSASELFPEPVFSAPVMSYDDGDTSESDDDDTHTCNADDVDGVDLKQLQQAQRIASAIKRARAVISTWSENSDSSEVLQALTKGALVVIRGLRQKPELNGETGIAIRQKGESDRWIFQPTCGGSPIAIKTVNLLVAKHSEPTGQKPIATLHRQICKRYGSRPVVTQKGDDSHP